MAKQIHRPLFWSRVDSVVVLLLENDKYMHEGRAKELTKLVKEKFDVGPRMAQKYIKEARSAVKKLGEQKRDKAFEKAMRDREFLIQKAKGVKDVGGNYLIEPDYKLALEIMKDRDKLAGLYVEKIEHSGTVDIGKINLQKLTDEQLTILESLIKRDEDPKPYLLSIGVNVDSN